MTEPAMAFRAPADEQRPDPGLESGREPQRHNAGDARDADTRHDDRRVCARCDWLVEHQVVDVAMESTGVYWKPLYNLLEALDLRPVVANAQHIKALPGRKTDVCDAAWIADLHRHGLVPTSFIPDRPQRELRELVRYRRAVVQERTREASRIQKVLEWANIKLASVASDVLGMSGRRMVQQIVAGCGDPEARWRKAG